MRIRRRLAQLAVFMVALPLVGWLLEEFAKRAEQRRPGSGSSRWLRQDRSWPTGSAVARCRAGSATAPASRVFRT